MKFTSVTPDTVKRFLLARYSDEITAIGINPCKVPGDFDFLLMGVVDSLGILEMVTAMECEFEVELDFSTLDVEQMTVLDPLAIFVATQVNASSRKSRKGAASNLLAVNSWKVPLFIQQLLHQLFNMCGECI